MKSAAQTHYITPDDLRIGYYVQLDLAWMDHPFAFRNFLIKNDEQITKIRKLNLRQIRYDPSRSTVAPSSNQAIPHEAEFPKTIQIHFTSKITSPTLSNIQQSNRLNQLNNIRLNCTKAFTKNATAAHEATCILIHHPKRAKEIATNLVDEMVNSIITESDVALHAISNNANVNGNSNHAINVTVLALMLAKSLGISADDAAMLGIASIFHEIGKTNNLQNKSYLDLHCEAGAKIARNSGLPERVANIIFQHLEYSDGSGHPMHIFNDKIDALARILILVNYFDNLCNPENAEEAMTPYEALQYMYAYQASKFDTSLIKHLIKLIGVYPSGSVVQLSNNAYGIVMAVNADKPLQPLVMIYSPEVARATPVVINLSEDISLSIKRCLNPNKIPKDAFDYLKPSKRICYYFHKKEVANTDEMPLENAIAA